MYKMGSTLIELIISLSIISILLTIGVKYLNNHSKTMCEIKTAYCDNSLLNFVQMGKEYCKKNNVSGDFLVDVINNRVTFSTNCKCIYVFKLPNDFKFKQLVMQKTIRLSTEGNVDAAGKILYENSYKESHGINIKVGINSINIIERKINEET